MASADANKKKELDQFVKRVQLRFLVRILGEPTKFLGMELTYMREQGICCVSQQLYVEKLARVFLKEQDTQYPAYPTTPMEVNAFDRPRLEKAEEEQNFEGPYRSIVGGLLYVSVCTRMDIGFALSILTQNLANPKPTHFQMAKRVLFYLVGTKSFGLVLGGEKLTTLIAFSDASFANDKIDRRSMGGTLFLWAIVPFRGLLKSTGEFKLCHQQSPK